MTNAQGMKVVGLAITSLLLVASGAFAAGDPEAGARAFRACAACHSVEPGRHMTGPSLAGVWERKAGSAEGFARYSPALKAADIVWNEKTLDAWLADPKAVIPGNTMTFAGSTDRQARADLIAFLKSSANQTAQGGGIGGGMMRAPAPQDLKAVGTDRQVSSIRYCGDTYRVVTRDGKTVLFWEFNLRFKTDSSQTGPSPGQPAIMRAGMMGDRASVIFAGPAEIAALIEKKC